jgi:uncharacterized protein YkwD
MGSRAGGWTVAVLGAAVMVAACVVPVAVAQAQCTGADRTAGRAGIEEARDAITCLVGEERRDAGRPAWSSDGRLAAAADRHAEDMVERDYFAHVSPGGRDVLDRVRRTGWGEGRRRWRVGEVLAWGSGRLSTPRALVNSWMRSAPHREVILDARFDVAGVGVTRGAPGGSRGAFTAVLVAAG